MSREFSAVMYNGLERNVVSGFQSMCIVCMRTRVFWDVKLCRLVSGCGRFEVSWCFKTSGTTDRATILWISQISNSVINSKGPMRRRLINISESTILLCQCLTQHTLTTSLNNAASAGDNNHRCQTFTGDLPLPATDTKCVHYCQQTEHEQGVQLSWPEQVQGKCDSPVGLLRGWPVAAELLTVQLLRLRAAWFTTDSPTNRAKRCVVDYWQSNF